MSKMDTDTKISYKEKMEEEYKILQLLLHYN